MRIAQVSPLPPSRTGVAEFATRIERELAKHAEVESFTEAERSRLKEFDARLYQIGNNPLHEGAYRAAMEVPGVVELHDAVLHHFQLGRLGPEPYVREFCHCHGDWLADLAKQLWRARGSSASEAMYFRYSMSRRVVESADRVIVHNPAALDMARESAPRANLVEIPHYVETPPVHSPEQLATTRLRLGIPRSLVVFGCFGFHRPTKRLRSVLRALRAVTRGWRLLVVGEFVSPDFEEALGGMLTDDRVVRIPYVSDEELWELAAITDVCVNLRWPTAGETSGIAMKLLALSKPVVVTRGPEWDRFPPGSLAAVDPGEVEEEMLAECLERLAGDEELRGAMGEAAGMHVRANHAIEAVAPRYLSALEV
jgi:glycosyltransferase involved in cell wall biosynthesis